MPGAVLSALRFDRGLCGVKLIPYKLEERRRWEINFEHLASRITGPRTKAIVLISPHNPTRVR